MSGPKQVDPEDLVFIGICDLAAQVRGKSIPAIDLPRRLNGGVGYTPANICISPFGTINASPFGTAGDIVLRPDATTQVDITFSNGYREHLILSNVFTLAGESWKYCPRNFLLRALARLERASACTVLASFEQEFVYTGVPAEPKRAYALASFRDQGDFGATLMAALRAAGMTPDAFLGEYGARQYEVTVAPTRGLRAADEAVLLRELTRGIAERAGHRAIFAPMVDPDGTGNGTHIHLSLRNAANEPTLHDARRPYGLSPGGENFVAGILEYMPALAAITAPSVASYFRLTPNRWAPTWANIASQDRAASLRICPGSATAFNIEYRVADATACPYMALGALIHAGVEGIERKLTLPEPVTKSIAAMHDAERQAANLRPLPASLPEALELLRTTPAAKKWFGPEFLDLYLNFKQDEADQLAGLAPQEICNRYAAVY